MKYLLLLCLFCSGCSQIDTIYGNTYWEAKGFDGERLILKNGDIRRQVGIHYFDIYGQKFQFLTRDDFMFEIGYEYTHTYNNYYSDEHKISAGISYPLWKNKKK